MSDARLLGLLLAVSVLIRVVGWMGAGIFGTDGTHYLLMADWIAAGRFDDALRIAYHPGYPVLIAVVKTVTGSTPAAGHLVAALLGGAAVIPLARLILRLFGRPVAVIAGVLYAFHPVLLEVHTDVLTEGAFHFFLLASIDLLWGQLEEPTLEKGAALGFLSAAAYLVRPEGLIAVAFALGWPLADLVRRRDRPAQRLGGVLATLAVVVVLCSPYLLWVRSVKGDGAWSMRPSAVSASRAVSMEEGAAGTPYLDFLKGLYRFTYLVMIPFYVAGLAQWRRVPLHRLLFYFSLPICYLAAILVTLRTHGSMSHRYVTAPMSLLLVLPALGLEATFRAAARRWPSPRARAVFCGGLLFLLGVAPGLRVFDSSRREMLGLYDAARWIRERGPVPRGISGPAQQVAYLTGCPSRYSAHDAEGLRRQIREEPVDYYVYTEKDVRKRPEYVAVLRSCDLLAEPVAVDGPPGALRVYIQRVR